MKPVKSSFATLILLLLICLPAASVVAQPAGNLPVMALAIEESLQARAAILMDMGTGSVLIEKLPDERLPIASITKVMTMLLAMEALEDGRITLDEELIASPHACSYGGSQIYLEAGERFSVKHMLMAVTIKSANDAAIALAEHIAGSESAFVALMNKRAEELGMENTHFVNACGLDDFSVTSDPGDRPYSSARDVAIMSQALLTHHDQLREWLTTRITYIQRSKGPIELFNTNHRFIRNFPGGDGLKTGLTDDAGWCLTATAKRGDLRLIAVVLGSTNDETRYQDIVTLLNYGFANYTGKRIVSVGEFIQTVPLNRGVSRELDVVAEQTVSILLKKGDAAEAYEQVITLYGPLFAPAKQGTVVGELRVVKDGKTVGKVNLIAGTNVRKLNYFGVLSRFIRELTGK